MAMQASAKKDPQGAERRRSQRVLLVIPVEVAWSANGSLRVKERAETEEVNTHGALLRMKTQLSPATKFELTHLQTQRSTEAQVVGVRSPTLEGLHRVAVELAATSEAFWGVSIPPLAGAVRD